MAGVALLCWEVGDGLGHIASLVQVARALKPRGFTCVFALPASRDPMRWMPRGSDVRRAPEWRKAVPAGFQRTGSSASMGDMLADIGMRSREAVRAQMVGWHLLFGEMLPDLLVADHAPGALLAARGRVASLAVGTGFAVPPPGLARFPPLHDLAPVRDDEEAVLEAANAALDRFGSPLIQALPQALRGDVSAACTLPLLDPYAAWRGDEPVLGPLFGEAPPPPEPAGGDAVVCYFQPGSARHRVRKLALSLKGLTVPRIAIVPGLSGEEAAFLKQAGVEVSAASLGSDTLRRAKLLVHAGGHGMACAALLAGIPQVVLSYDIEKNLTGRALSERGVAKHLNFDAAAAEDIGAAIGAAASDAGMQEAALAAAGEHAAYRAADPASMLADRCAALTG